MQSQSTVTGVTGHKWLYRGKRGSTWYAKVRRPERLPDGRVRVRQENIKLGPTWPKGERGRPADGFLTEKAAEAALQALLTDIRRDALPGLTRTGATFAEAAEEWLRHAEAERAAKPSTMRDYRSAVRAHLLPTFGAMQLEAVTPAMIESWRARLLADGLTRRTANKLVTIMHGIFERARRAWGLRENPIADVERLPERYDPARYDFYSPEEVWALVRAAESEQDGAIFLTAAFTGLRRGELLALRVRDVDFGAEVVRVLASVDSAAGVGSPKSGRGRTVPMAPDVARMLARVLGREHFTAPDDPVFVGENGRHLDGSALRRRYKSAQARAGLRPLRFHDLRHTFGSLAINVGSTVEVQAWLGHADSRTTSRYMHYKRRNDEARRLADAFRVTEVDLPVATDGTRAA